MCANQAAYRRFLINGARGDSIRVKAKRNTPGKVLIATGLTARTALRRKLPPDKGFTRVQPSRSTGCTFLFGGVRFANF
jgi:hypothetical protein